jgi:hypothetical protein
LGTSRPSHNPRFGLLQTFEHTGAQSIVDDVEIHPNGMRGKGNEGAIGKDGNAFASLLRSFREGGLSGGGEGGGAIALRKKSTSS